MTAGQVFLAAVFFAAALPACTTIRDLSRRDPYQSWVGRELTLQREMLLCQATAYNFWGIPHREHTLCEEEAMCTPQDRGTMAVLPRGTLLRIDRVVQESGMAGSKVLAYGRLTHPRTGEPVDIRYLWSLDGGQIFPAAPWEDRP